MITGIDHLIIRAGDLDTAVEAYQQLGFTVVPGGRHPSGTHNALISFQDGSYLELIAFWDPDRASGYWNGKSSEGGLVHFACASDDLEADILAIGERGLPFNGPNDGARTRPDGVEVAWKTASAKTGPDLELPFLIQDVTEREVRVPGGEATHHVNGVLGLNRITVAVGDLGSASQQYQALLDTPPASTTPNELVEFLVGSHRITLQEHGSGQMQGLIDATLYGPEAREIDPARASGARLRIEERTPS